MIKKLFNSNLLKLNAMNSIEGFGWSLIGIFIPIYLLSLGYSLKQVFIYFIIQNTSIMLSSFFVVIIGKKISLKKILIFRFPFLLLFLILLYNLKTINFPINLLAIIDGFQLAFFWLPMHILFSQFANKNDIGSSTGKLFAIPKFVTMFCPLIGGLIAINFGFKILFITATTFFLAGLIPILYAKISPLNYDFKIEDGLTLYKKYKKYFYSEICNNIGEEIEGVIWPIFVYINLINIASIGLIGTLLAVSSAIFTLVVGRIADKTDKMKMIKASVIFISIVWILRFIFNNELAFYILTIISGIVFVVFSIPYYSIFYQIAQKEKAPIFFAFREIPVNIARVIVFSFGIVLATNLKIFFIIAALAYIYFLFWNKSKTNGLIKI
ncbi:MAG: MFS transporter [Candidatus Falkowbacteria bacterium]